jgi:endonuclease YncB( thermonuclease family)
MREIGAVPIAVPGLNQACEAGGKPYPCGRIAPTGLIDLVAVTEVECVPAFGGGSAPIAARCRAGGFDLSANMVHTGWALADWVTGTAFTAIEEEA